MDAPKYQQSPIDPAFAGVQAQAQNDRIAAIQTEVGHDTASLLMRYGRQQAVATATGTPSSATPLIGMSTGYGGFGMPA